MGHPFHYSVIFCEATAIYGVIVAIILQTKIEYVPANPDGSYPSAAVFSGYGVFGSGITVGLANLVCGCAESGAMFLERFRLCCASIVLRKGTAYAHAHRLRRARSQALRGDHREQLRALRRSE